MIEFENLLNDVNNTMLPPGQRTKNYDMILSCIDHHHPDMDDMDKASVLVHARIAAAILTLKNKYRDALAGDDKDLLSDMADYILASMTSRICSCDTTECEDPEACQRSFLDALYAYADQFVSGEVA